MGSIGLKELSKSFGGGSVTAVRSVDLEIDDGEFVVFVGPSGCGKSTLLRMIAGLEIDQQRRVEINGKVVNGVAARNRDIAMVFQNYALYPQMTVRQNIAFALELRKFSQSAIDERVNEAARFPRPARTSRPQAEPALRRPAPARRHGPRDRAPSSGLPARRAAFQSRRQAQGATSGRTRAAAPAAWRDDRPRHPRPGRGDDARQPRRGVLARHASAIRHAAPFYDAPKNVFVAGFIGSPAMNFLEGDCRATDRRSRSVRRRSHPHASGDTQAGRVLLGIRPEHIAWRPQEMREPAAWTARST